MRIYEIICSAAFILILIYGTWKGAFTAHAETPQVPYIILDERELDVRTQAASMVADVENAHGRGREKRVLTGWVALPRDQYDAMRR